MSVVVGLLLAELPVEYDFKKRFPPIADELAKLKKAGMLDGELVALDEDASAL